MLKFYCEKCKEEFKPETSFLEGVVQEMDTSMGFDEAHKKVLSFKPKKTLIHLCPNCLEKFKKWLEEKEK